MPRVLMYHDVMDGDYDASGFPGGGAARYKLCTKEFYRHLEAIAALPKAPVLLPHLLEIGGMFDSDALLMTFDDGGISAATIIADALERHGWLGHFFITVDYIGQNGFMNVTQIRELEHRGHIVGTHSCSHPARMSACTRFQLMDEWQRSREILSEILGKPVTVASVPGGYYSNKVAEAAAASGLFDLFTSEPTTRTTTIGGIRVYGRYAVHRGTTARMVAALASGSPKALFKEAAAWKLKKVVKIAGGRMYPRLRQWILRP